MSHCIASKVLKVSDSDAPFFVALASMFKLITSAESRLAASSNVVRVRVLGSKKRLMTVLPRNKGTVFTARSPSGANRSALSRMSISNDRGRFSILKKCLSLPSESSWLFTEPGRGHQRKKEKLSPVVRRWKSDRILRGYFAQL